MTFYETINSLSLETNTRKMAIRMLFALPFFVMSAKNTPADDVLAKPEYDWLNKSVIISTGMRKANSVVIHFYRVL